MDKQELGQQIIALTETLYRVSFSLLRNEADREDAVQSAIEKGWWKSALLRDDTKLKPWLIRILLNECYTILRRNKREFLVDTPPDSADDSSGYNSQIRDEVLALPEDLRLPLVLHYMEGFSIKEIASALRCPQGTILSRMNRGRNALKKILTEAESDDER